MHFLDEPVQIMPVYRTRNVPIPNWIIAQRPIDLKRLDSILSNWAWSASSADQRASSAYRRVMELIRPAVLEPHTHPLRIRLFDEQHHPEGDLTFPAFALSVSGSIVGRPCRLSCGQELIFERMQGGTGSEYELVSQLFWHNNHPFAIGLTLSTQTVPPNREVRLNVKLHLHRYAHGNLDAERGKTVYLPNGINALIRRPGKPWCRVALGYKGKTRGIAWDELDAKHLKEFMGIDLPNPLDYLTHMDEWAQPGSNPQILAPQAASATWQKKHYVEDGLTFNDKAEIFEFVSACLEGIAKPCEPPQRESLRNFVKLYDEKKLDEAGRLAWASSNRRRLSVATGSERIALEFIGRASDEDELAVVRKEAEAFLGPKGSIDGIEVSMTTRLVDQAASCGYGRGNSDATGSILVGLDNASNAAVRERVSKIAKVLGPAPLGIPTACIVMLPGQDAYRKSDMGKDPKEAIRAGLARTGRLSQFLIPRTEASEAGEQDTFDTRAQVAFRDLMRQLGFVFDFKDTRQLKCDAPLYGIHLFTDRLNHQRLPEALIATKVCIASGESLALCPQINKNWMPYWKAQIELARISGPFSNRKAHRIEGIGLKDLIDIIANEAPEGSLLLVNSYSAIRGQKWWPGISDKGLAEGPLRYGPASEQGSSTPMRGQLFDTSATNLHVLRVRLGENGEVPDYYTDLSVTQGNAGKKGPARASKQGIFNMGGYWIALAPRLGDTPYKLAYYGSKFDNPGSRYLTKSLNEYVLLTSDDEELARECVLRAEASRSGLVQLYKRGMRVNLPTPLHLAKKMEEYIWSPTK
ncbi:MAG: DUF3962 domain-containing protein [Coriobacteriaceae bacterium]|nr:DUF3962 domain-containing protein [Coriobacteriaceae bacterium]